MSQLDDAAREQAKQAPDDNPDHSILIAALHEHLARKRLMVDAVGHWRDRDSEAISTLTTDIIAREFAMDYRRDKRIGMPYICETLESIAHQWELRRRQELIAVLIGASNHGPDASSVHLIAWLCAVLGRVPQADEVAALSNWLWLVKRSMTDGDIEHHLMLVYFGMQGAGKSRAVAKLVSPLREMALVPCDASILVDQRWRPALAKYLAGFWDELDGLERSDRGALKQVITATMLPYRPMRTTRLETVPVRCRFIGASNTPVSALFRDPTGARRFYEFRTADRIDWETINRIDYSALWASVSHLETAPLLPALVELRKDPERQRWRDTVAEWLADETWTECIDAEGRMQSAVDVEAGVVCVMAYRRYQLWCKQHDETHPLGQSQFGVRMLEEGFTKSRPGGHATATRAWVYSRASEARPPASTSKEGDAGSSETEVASKRPPASKYPYVTKLGPNPENENVGYLDAPGRLDANSAEHGEPPEESPGRHRGVM